MPLAMNETFPETSGPNHGAAGRRPTMKRGRRGRGRQPQHGLARRQRRPEGRPGARREGPRARSTLLGYRHNATATTLRRADRLSASIGLIFDDVANPFFAARAPRRSRTSPARAACSTFAGSSDEDAERERELAEAFARARRRRAHDRPRRRRDHSYLLRDRDAGVALVFVDRPPGFIDADFVLDRQRRRRARGGRRTSSPPGTGGSPTSATGRASTRAVERLRGHTRGARGRGRPIRSRARPDGARGQRDGAPGHATSCSPATNPPTALFTTQNLITIGAVARPPRDGAPARRRARRLRRRRRSPTRSSPGSRSSRRTPNGLGRAAAELLFARLDGDERARPRP